jgi:hypothetical protein
MKRPTVFPTTDSQRLVDIAARLDVEEGIRQGLDDVAHGRNRPVRRVFGRDSLQK